MSYNQETGDNVRQCKQCDKVIAEPLKVGELLYMFCSAHCRTVWDHERAFRAAEIKKTRRSFDD